MIMLRSEKDALGADKADQSLAAICITKFPISDSDLHSVAMMVPISFLENPNPGKCVPSILCESCSLVVFSAVYRFV